ncbi:hypothetical protein [Halococcus sediminicola]|uniref:hypothetical protein n=1 Tax=Halococcus sediminicola TaxID=1264579 RepID=UPI000AA42C9E|nr:hypothetical protein [Halococcus sediminicola]
MFESDSRRSAVQVSTLLVVLCIVLGVAGGVVFVDPVSAQAGNTTNTTNTTSTPTPGEQLSRLNGSNTTGEGGNQTTPLDASNQRNQTSFGVGGANRGVAGGNTSTSVSGNGSSSGGGGGKCGVTNPGACIPSPGETLREFVNFIENSVTKNVQKVVGGFNDIFVGIPAPGDVGDPSTWASPENGWWPDIYETYYIFMTFAAAALLPAIMIAMDRADPYRREKELKRLAGHGVMILLGALLVMPASLHLFDAVSTSLAPSAGEFLDSAAGSGKLSIGVILTGALSLTQSTLVLVGLAVIVMIYVAIHILAAFWPIFWVARLAPVSSIEWVGNAGIASFYGLCFLRVLQSGMLRFLFGLSWDPIEAGIATAFGSVLLTIVGLVFVFIIFPKAFARKGVPASAMVSGGSQAMKKAPERYENSRERIGNVQQRLEGIRGDGSGNSTRGSTTSESSTQVGSVGSTAASNNHHGGSVRRVGEVTSDKLRGGVDASQVERRRHDIHDQLD